MKKQILFALAFAVTAAHAQAGTIPVAWDAVTDADLAGYRIFVGTAPGVYTLPAQDVPVATSTAIAGLTDCTNYYFAVKARDLAGNLSATYSTELQGWPAITVATISPTTWETGKSATLALVGTNFRSGAAVTLTGVGVQAITASVAGLTCTGLAATFVIPASSPVGARTVRVQNSDGTFRDAPGVSLAADAAPAPVVNFKRADR